MSDAFIRSNAQDQTWTVGTAAVELVLQFGHGHLRAVSLKNKVISPIREYVQANDAADVFALQTPSDRERYQTETVWTKYLPVGSTADPADDQVQIPVRRGDLIGFAVGPHGDYAGDETQWITVVQYTAGERYSSAEAANLEQGPIWFYSVHQVGSGFFAPIDSVERDFNAQEEVRVPSAGSGYRVSNVPHAGRTMMHPSNLDVVRIWKAPMDGMVQISGRAQHLRGFGDVDLEILRIRELPPGSKPAALEPGWTVERSEARAIKAGGRPAAELVLSLKSPVCRARVHVLAYPRTSVLRQWVEVENLSPMPLALSSPTSLALNLQKEEDGGFVHYWMIGANNGATQGLLQKAPVSGDYHREIAGQMSSTFAPWTALQRSHSPGDGWFVGLDYLGAWRMVFQTNDPTSLSVVATVGETPVLSPGQSSSLPTTTLGVFEQDLDDMAQRIYNWQYEYLWDYTRDDYYAGMQWDSAWYNDARNLQENFAGRLGQLDMDYPDMMRTVGMEILWDDAGWSENSNIWTPSREGPDFSQTLRYLHKMGMKWALWFCGRPTAGLMDTKVGSWGNFQWRTDGVGGFDLLSDRAYRDQITRFRGLHPRASFHTCNGGGTYAHVFDIQRYADINMFSDPGGGDQSNYYFSYFDTPDKWMDLMPSFGSHGAYLPDTARQIMTMVPCWDLAATATEQEQLRRMADLYHYWLHLGVAGRWTYAFHPRIQGDAEYYYFQRTSYDRKRACIILKHRTTNPVVIYPKGLLSSLEYEIAFESNSTKTSRSGADLMANGIALADQKPGELIYLNLPNRPGSGADKVPPRSPGRVLTRRETNVGHTGVGVYWSPGADDNWVSYYQVRRDAQVVGTVSVGTYYFDHSPGWSLLSDYAVRTVDGDGNTSDWTQRQPFVNEPLAASALGGHFPEAGREGWQAETSTSDGVFLPMQWVPAAKSPAGDVGGTPNQPGGAEGYWEGAGTARVGRGWQQASPKAACARTWIAPQSGKIRILGRVFKEFYRRNSGSPLHVRILKGTTQIWPEHDWSTIPVGSLTGCTHDLSVDVGAGEAIRFVLDRGTDPQNDIVAWMPQLIYLTVPETASAASVVRIRCGATDPVLDENGNTWSEDKFYTGGHIEATDSTIDATEDESTLYQSGREGRDFRYSIPVASGLYTLRLKFVEPQFQWSFQRPFNLEINGRRVLRNFDICQAARGPRRAYDRVFHYLVPDADGRLVLHFSGGFEPLQASEDALVQAIEVVPELKPALRVQVGSEIAWVDWNSFVWSPDSGFAGGEMLHTDQAVTQAAPTVHDQALYQDARSGRSFSYTFSLPPGLYTMHLKFAELWLKSPGQRPMDIDINGRRKWSHWDPATAAGKVGMAADIRTEDVVPDHKGQITVHLAAAGSNDAILQGIEIE